MNEVEVALYVGALVGSVVSVLTRPFSDALSRRFAAWWRRSS